MLPLWWHDKHVNVESMQVQLLLEWFECDPHASPFALNRSLRTADYLAPPMRTVTMLSR